MSRNILPLLLICVLNTLIGSYVLRHQPGASPNRAFAFFAYSVAAWTLSIALTHHIHGPSTLFARITFATASIMVFALLTLFRSFPYESGLRFSWTLRLFGTGAFLLSVFAFTPLIVARAELERHGLTVTYGRLHPLYGAYIYSCFGVSVFILIRKYWLSTGLVRLQFHYLFLGLLLPGLGVTFTNLLIPLVLGSSRAGQYGPYFALVFLAFSAHALIHYRFMDIRLVLRRGATFLLALAASVLVLMTVLLLSWSLIPFEIQAAHIFILIGCSIVLSLLLPLIRRAFTRLLDHYVYRDDINYQRALHDASRALVGILDLDELLAYTVSTTLRAVRSERAALYLLGPQGFRLHFEQMNPIAGGAPSPALLPQSSFVVRFFDRNPEPLVAEEVTRRFPEVISKELLPELRRRRWGLVLPIHLENTLQGLVAVEPKLSGDPFFPDELQFVSILINQVGIAVAKAQLYRQVTVANEYIQNIIRTMDSGVITVHSGGKVAMCNATAERLLGMPRQILTSLSVAELPPPLGSQLQAALSDGQPKLQVETTLSGDPNRPIPIVCSTSALTDTQGSVLGALAVFSDLSKIKALENEKRRAERLASFGALASGIAHEIKNPLVAIKTFAELLPERFTEVDFREDFSKVVVTEIDRIDGLVSRLRGIAAPTPQSTGPIDIREPIRETLALLRAQLEQTRTALHREFEDPAPYVAIDASQLKQLFLNLFMNAIEAMGPGGQLTVRVSRREAHGTLWVVVAVSDTGPGIPDSLRPHIFEPFFTTKARGSGLGLAICRGIADANRGTIRAERNGSGPGTTMVVELPATRQTREVAEPVLHG